MTLLDNGLTTNEKLTSTSQNELRECDERLEMSATKGVFVQSRTTIEVSTYLTPGRFLSLSLVFIDKVDFGGCDDWGTCVRSTVLMICSISTS